MSDEVMSERPRDLAGPTIMLVSALLFGFMGFFAINWSTPGVGGQVVLFRVLLGWTLKISAVLFGAGALLTFVSPVVANGIYAVTGVVGAGLFVVVAVMDIADKQHGIAPYAPFLLFVFAAWNGYASWTSLAALLASRGTGPPEP